MSFIKGRHLEFLAHNYDRATKFCALVGGFTQIRTTTHIQFLLRQFYVTQTVLDSF